MQLDIYTKDGQQSGQIELNDSVFGVEPNEHAMHLDVLAHLARRRSGTAKTKVRSDVRGGGRKPWRQKGRGTARAGSTRSPIWVGGGTIHGPKPHKYNLKLTKKLKRLARKSAYSLRANEKNIFVVEDFTLEEIKTKEMATVLKNLNLAEEKILILTPNKDDKLYLSVRNIPKVNVQVYNSVSTYDLLNHKKLLLFKDAVSKIEESFKN